MDICRRHLLRDREWTVQLCVDHDRFADQSRQSRNGRYRTAVVYPTDPSAHAYSHCHTHLGKRFAAPERSAVCFADRFGHPYAREAVCHRDAPGGIADGDACGSISHADAPIGNCDADPCSADGHRHASGAYADEYTAAARARYKDAGASGGQYSRVGADRDQHADGLAKTINGPCTDAGAISDRGRGNFSGFPFTIGWTCASLDLAVDNCPVALVISRGVEWPASVVAPHPSFIKNLSVTRVAQ